MRLRNDDRRYGAVTQGFHWLVAALVIALFAIGWNMDELPVGPDKLRLFNLHKSVGITLLAVMLLRLVWRRISPPPSLPAAMPDWERKAATAAHHLLYVLLIAQPVIGILHSNAANFPLAVYGLFVVPPVIGPSEGLKEVLEAVHGLIANVIALLLILHIGAALRHHFMLKDDVMRRMLPWGGP